MKFDRRMSYGEFEIGLEKVVAPWDIVEHQNFSERISSPMLAFERYNTKNRTIANI